MNVLLKVLACVGALCACSSVYGQTARTRILEFFPYQPPQPSIPAFPEKAVILPNAKKLLSLRTEEDIAHRLFLSSVSSQKDILSGGLLEMYQKGFSIDLPFAARPTQMRIRNGFSWDIDSNTQFVFPSFSGGFKWKKTF